VKVLYLTALLALSAFAAGCGAGASASSGAGAALLSRMFATTGPAGYWLYARPTNTGIDISSTISSLPVSINTHDGGFDYPVQYTDGTHGTTTFNDAGVYGRNDFVTVPNPSEGYKPSVGGWGANDGHLVVVNTSDGTFYDFWQLTLDSSGNPNTHVGQIVQGSFNTSDGRPGTTAAQITGLAGDVLPGELDCTTCLNHALSIVVYQAMNSPLLGKQAPVFHTDGSVSGGVFREGAKLQFDPSINVDSLNASTAVKAIMKALQQYGGVITDQTGGRGISIYSALPTQPDTTGINLISQHLLIYY
jgi:hypothetical protein